MINTTRTRQSKKSKFKGRKSLKLTVESFSESKYLTDSCHHFPLTSMATMSYSDTGIFIGGWTATNKISQGVGNNQRIGNRCRVKFLHYKFNLFSQTGQPDTARIMVIKDTAPKGVVPVLGDIFDNPNNNLSVISPNSMGQYCFLYDKLIDLPSVDQIKSVDIKIPYNVETKYFSNGQTLADIENNAIYVMVISVNGLTSTEVLQFFSVIRYKDF